MLLPLHLIATTLLGFLSLALLAASLSFLYRAIRKLRRRYFHAAVRTDSSSVNDRRLVARPVLLPSAVFRDTAVMIPFALSVLLLLFSFAGRHVVQYAFPLSDDEPKALRNGVVQQVDGSGGANIRVENYGPADAPTLLFTHGWGMDSTEWYYAKRHLSTRFQLVLWDLPGLGESAQPRDRNFALESLARDLRAVLATAHGKPVVLVGHSIGGMINLTFCRLYPELLGHEVAGIVQVDTSYTNPVKTTKNSGLSQALQKPVAEPILHGMIALSPLVRMMNWFSYENGTSYLMNAKSSFAGAETRGQIDLVSRLQAEASPAVVARGTLAMFHWDATPVLPHVNVPVLLLVGQEDTTTLPSASRYMRETIPQAELAIVNPSAHYSLLEQNQEVDSKISQFALQCLGEPNATRARLGLTNFPSM